MEQKEVGKYIVDDRNNHKEAERGDNRKGTELRDNHKEKRTVETEAENERTVETEQTAVETEAESE